MMAQITNRLASAMSQAHRARGELNKLEKLIMVKR